MNKSFYKIFIFLSLNIILIFSINVSSSETPYSNSYKETLSYKENELDVDKVLSNEIEKIFISYKNDEKILDLSKLKPAFTIKFGSNEDELGKLNYNPGASNGLSGGAIPTDVKINNKVIYFSDGYGPRIVKYSEKGEYLGEIDLNHLRPENLSQFKALCGFKFDFDKEGCLYVLDSEKAEIFDYKYEKLYSKIKLKDSFKNQFQILDIHPYMEITTSGYIALKLTILESEKNNEYGYDYIPIKKSKLIGVIIDKNGNFVSSFDPNYKFVSNNDTLYTISSSDEKGFTLLECLINDKMLINTKEIYIEDPNWEYGDLIGTTAKGLVYYWAKHNEIGIIDIKSKSISRIKIPDLKFNPFFVSEDGNIILINTTYNNIQAFLALPNN